MTVALVGGCLIVLYAFLSTIDQKIAIAALGAGILFLWMWYDIRIGLWLLLFSVLAGQLVRFSFGGGAILLSDGVIGILLVVWVANILIRKRVFRSNLLWWGLVFFWLISFLINMWVVPQYGADKMVDIWLYWIRLVMYSTCLPITWSIVEWYGESKRYLWWFLWMGVIFLALGFLQLIIFPDISFLTEFGWDPHVGRLLSTFLDPNFAGAILLLFFATSFSFYFHYREWTFQKLSWAVLSGLFLLGIVLTLSRSAYVALAVIFSVMAYKFDKRLLLMGGLLALLILVNSPRIEERVQGIFKVDNTAQLRLESWEDSLAIAEDNLWTGVGYNALAIEQLRRGIIVDTNVHSAGGSDSSYLTVWSTMGLFGLLSFAFILVVYFGIIYYSYWKEKKDWEYKYFLLGSLMGILGVMIHAQFTNSLFYVHILIPVWFLMGLAMGWKTSFEDQGSSNKY
ncbi:MAG: O-antigen ligase family protein [Patescibacteria group bacterium]